MRVPILTYHAVGDGPPPLFTPARELAAHLDALRSSGRTTVRLGALVDVLRDGRELPENAVVLTFDDGDASVAEIAAPLLRERGLTATIFLVADLAGKRARWNGLAAPAAGRELLSLEKAAALAEEGWELGAHSRTHRSLRRLSPLELLAEVDGSRERICSGTGHDPRVFAYPYGVVTKAAREAASRAFDGAVGTRLSLADSGDDRYDLPRIDAYYVDPFVAGRLDAPVQRLSFAVRRCLRTVRRAVKPDDAPRG